MDYSKYHCSMLEDVICMATAAAVTALLAWLFYRRFASFVLFPAVYGYCICLYRSRRLQKQKEQLIAGFKEGMLAVTASLLAGYSMENAWKETEKELRELFGEKHPIVREFALMNSKTHMNQPLEEALKDFAFRSGCEDIESFAEIFSFAKRGGGDFLAIIQTTVQRLSAKMEVEKEIQTVIAGKKFENRIMNLMPVFLLLYMNFTSGEFLEPLYGNIAGAAIMTGAIILYGVVIWWSGKLMNIRV